MSDNLNLTEAVQFIGENMHLNQWLQRKSGRNSVRSHEKQEKGDEKSNPYGSPSHRRCHRISTSGIERKRLAEEFKKNSEDSEGQFLNFQKIWGNFVFSKCSGEWGVMSGVKKKKNVKTHHDLVR